VRQIFSGIWRVRNYKRGGAAAAGGNVGNCRIYHIVTGPQCLIGQLFIYAVQPYITYWCDMVIQPIALGAWTSLDAQRPIASSTAWTSQMSGGVNRGVPHAEHSKHRQQAQRGTTFQRKGYTDVAGQEARDGGSLLHHCSVINIARTCNTAGH
jgi:hypothetical protein